ncbi:MAG: DUF1592 domain-containing protein [Fuerstiella sp.]
MFRSALLLPVLFLSHSAASAVDAKAARAELTSQFNNVVQPFLRSYCLDCHGAAEPEAMLNLARFQTAEDVASGHQTWHEIAARVQAGEMPPSDFEPQPTQQTRRQVVDWIERFRRFEAERLAGDPGLVLVRRLSNAEYNNTIRSLTDHDLQPTATFPVDPANEAGFDNSGESLAMSPALMNKYMEAARFVSQHLVLSPTGLAFAAHPVMTDTDRDKYCVRRIVNFYHQQPTQLKDYFFALWTARQANSGNRAGIGSSIEFQRLARQHKLSAKYLRTIAELLEQQAAVGPIALLQQQFQDLPDDRDAAAGAAADMEQFVMALRARLVPEVRRLSVDGIHTGAQAFVLDRNRQYAANRRRFDEQALRPETDSDDESTTVATDPIAAALTVPGDPATRQPHIEAFEQFCSVFPDAFFISERGRDYVEESKKQQGEKGRLLSAGFHSMMGYFRDDQPLYDLILDETGQRRIDELWDELNTVASAPMRQYLSFLWFERTDSRYLRDAEFDFARPENLAALSEPLVQQLAEQYLAKAERSGASPEALQAIQFYFDDMNQQMRRVERLRKQAEPLHVDALLQLASKAWRRPLSDSERSQLRQFYRSLIEEDQLNHEQAVRDVFTSILLSPHFSYRLDLQAHQSAPQPLTDYELASRLSYFLWAGPPDERLLQLAAEGRLRNADVLKAEAARMLKDDRVTQMVTEFVANWLGFRRFEQHNSVDRERFPTFDDQLRASMFEEPIRFVTDLIQHDRSVKQLLNAEHTFVNRSLAQHYQIPFPADTADDEWLRLEDARRYGRGGVLPMSVFLTINAPGLRTSPVKRGYWVVRQLLGERIPPPPPGVPELPADESQLGELTLREALARHRELPACAVCHDRFDSVGVVFESYGPVGERRDVDLGDRPVDTAAVFPDGVERRGVDGLRDYLQQHRRADFVRQLNRKLLSYALSRSLILPDELLLEQMEEAVENNNGRFGAIVDVVITSPQFLNKRGRPED